MAKKDNQYTSAWNERDTRNDAAKLTLKTLRKRTRWMRILVFMACILSPLALVLSTSAASTVQAMQDTVDNVSSTSQTEKPGMEVGLQAVQTWLGNKENNPYPGGTANLQWNGATKVASHTDTSANEVTTAYWSHRFSFTNLVTGATVRVAQLVTVANGVETAIGSPSILPPSIAANAGGASSAVPGYPSLDQSESLGTLVDQWSKVYVGDDDDALTVLIGDSNTNHLYKAASLGAYQSATVNWAVWAGDGKGGDPVQGSEYGAVGITITYSPSGGSKTANVNTSLTLLVAHPTGGAPKVVAWGADSNIKALKPFGNAVDKTLARGANSGSNDSTDSSASPSSDQSTSNN